jgi:hypothetical protein
MFLKRLVTYKLIAPIILILCLYAILSGSDWLLWRISFLFGFHLGTVISWIGLVACSFISTRLNKDFRFMRVVSLISFYMSIFWLLLSFILAGNNNLIFTPETNVQWNLWQIITFFPLVVFLFSIIFALFVEIIRYNRSSNF